MEEMPRDAGQMEPMSSNADWFPSGFMEKLYSMSLNPHEDTLHIRESDCDLENNELTSQKASQILWATGSFSGLIPSGFYSVIPDKKIKEIFCNIPSLDEISSSGLEGPRADVILVDVEKDKKLSLLKQLIVTMVKGSNSYPVSVIKKIAGLVFEVYGRPNSEQCSGKVPLEEPVPIADTRGIQLLGQIRNASCRPRAILFKVLADAVGLESKIIVGLPTGAIERMDSCRHMSVVVVLKSNELLVDLLRFPGQLVPFSATAVLRFHLAAGIESDSAENDSCDSPLEPNSPMWSISDRQSCDGNWSSEQDEFYLQSHYQQKVEALLNVSGPYKNILLQPVASTEGKPSLLNDESYIANAVWRKNRRKAMVEQRTAGSSPEHPLLRRQGRSLLSSPGDGQSFSDYKDGIAVSRSVGASTSGKHRTRRRSISSITPEIGDDIVRAVRAMNEALKQRNLSKEHGTNTIQKYIDAPRNVSDFQLDTCGEIYSERYATAGLSMKRLNANQKAISLPLSPIEFGDRANENRFTLASAWNRVFQSATFLNKTLLPFQEWSIDFSELTISTRVGIGFFGEVFRGLWNGTDVAVKIFLEQELTTENIEDFCNEIFILSRLRHPNVILFLGVCTRPPHLSMVTEYMDMGSLYNLIHMSGQKKKISWHRRLKMLRDICRGLMYMHRMKIVHRDLKSANCLVNQHLTVKICDFGLSRVIAEVTVRDCSSAGTPEWMAPELIRNEPFTEKCDIFSFGVIMWELCTLSRPWEGVPSVQVVHAVANEGSRLEIPEGPMGKLISDCWAEPDERPNCEEILSRLLDCEYTLS